MRKKNLLTIHILDSRIPKSLEKPSKLKSYNGNEHTNEYVKHVGG